MKHILIVEDDPSIQKGLKASFEAEGYSVSCASDGETGFSLATTASPDIVILDIMLPKKNGQDICRDLRQLGIQTPILMLTSKADELDKVLGLELGADDYLTKPFSLRELQARVKALLRRNVAMSKKELEEYRFSDVIVDFRKRDVQKGNVAVRLTPKEFDVLKYLIEHEGEPISRDTLLTEIWGYKKSADIESRTVDSHIDSLRKKVDAKPSKHFISVHGIGYKFVK